MIYLSLGILILTWGAQIFLRFFVNGRGTTRIATQINAESSILKRSNLLILTKLISGRFDLQKLVRIFFIFSVVLIFILLFYQSYQQYQSWSQNDVSKYLLPPHQSINYFIFYTIARFFAPYLISLAIAILFLISAKALNKRYQERFFYPEEPYFGALAIFLVSHPGWILYIIAVILIYLLIQLFTLIYYKLHSNTIERSNAIERRVSLRYVWLPAAIFIIIIINYWLQTLSWWNLLKI